MLMYRVQNSCTPQWSPLQKLKPARVHCSEVAFYHDSTQNTLWGDRTDPWATTLPSVALLVCVGFNVRGAGVQRCDETWYFKYLIITFSGGTFRLQKNSPSCGCHWLQSAYSSTCCLDCGHWCDGLARHRFWKIWKVWTFNWWGWVSYIIYSCTMQLLCFHCFKNKHWKHTHCSHTCQSWNNRKVSVRWLIPTTTSVCNQPVMWSKHTGPQHQKITPAHHAIVRFIQTQAEAECCDW